MAHVIGIPLLKGNSHVLVSASLEEQSPGVVMPGFFSGQAVGYTGIFGGLSPVVVALDRPGSVGFYGFLCEINSCSGKATVCRAAESLPLPSDGTIVGAGPALVDPATGLISATGTIEVAGVVLDDGAGTLAAYDGKTGDAVANPVLINLSVSPVPAAAPPLTSAAKTTKAKKELI